MSGRLILGRDIAKKIVEARASGKQIEQYIYSTANGDIEDFLAIEHCSAYFTSNPARTEFCAVQSVLEGKPIIIAADVEFHESDEAVELFLNSDEENVSILSKKRWITARRDDGTIVSIEEGQKISISDTDGIIFEHEIDIEPSKIRYVYETLIEAYTQAQKKYGIYNAWKNLQETDFFKSNATKLKKSINTTVFIGFQKLVQFSLAVSSLDVFVNVHKSSCVAMAKLVSSTIRFDDSGLQIISDKSNYGVGRRRRRSRQGRAAPPRSRADRRGAPPDARTARG